MHGVRAHVEGILYTIFVSFERKILFLINSIRACILFDVPLHELIIYIAVELMCQVICDWEIVACSITSVLISFNHLHGSVLHQDTARFKSIDELLSKGYARLI